MTWIIIGLIIAVGFGEYWCAHYFATKVFRVSGNRAHLILALLILSLVALPSRFIVAAFFIASLFCPAIIWLGFKLLRK